MADKNKAQYIGPDIDRAVSFVGVVIKVAKEYGYDRDSFVGHINKGWSFDDNKLTGREET